MPRRAFLRLRITTAMERNAALSAIREAIVGCRGWIVDHSLFSNISATVNFEIPGDAVARLTARLADAGLPAETEDDPPAPPADADGGDLRGSLAVTFIHDEPDLKRDVPAFG